MEREHKIYFTQNLNFSFQFDKIKVNFEKSEKKICFLWPILKNP